MIIRVVFAWVYLVNFFVLFSGCVDIVPASLSIENITLNDSNLDLGNLQESRNNISLSPRISIRFSETIDISDLQGKISLTKENDATSIRLDVTQSNPKRVEISLSNDAQLEKAQTYIIRIDKGIEAEVESQKISLGQDISFRFKTITMNSEALLSVVFNDAVVAPSVDTFILRMSEVADLTKVILTLAISAGASIHESDVQIKVDDGSRITKVFDFSKNVFKTFKVLSEDGSNENEFIIQAQPGATSSREITLFGFKGEENVLLSKNEIGKITGNRISVILPPDISRSSLVPFITHTGKSITPKTNEVRDFTNPIIFTVVSEDSLTRDYEVVVTNLIVHTVSFNYNDGSSLSGREVEDGKKVTAPERPTRDGYTFDRWFADSDFQNEYNFDNPVLNNIELYAKWDINSYTVTFNTQPVNIDVVSQSIQYEDKAVRPRDDEMRDARYAFIGWFEDLSDLTTLFDFNNVAITSDLEIHAGWMEVSNYVVKSDTLEKISNPGLVVITPINMFAGNIRVLEGENVVDDLDPSISNIYNIFGGYFSVQSPDVEQVFISNSVEIIGENAFYNITTLTNVVIPNSVTEIKRFAFGRCSNLLKITIPSSVTTIGNQVFSGCQNLVDVKVEANTPPSIGENIFSSTHANLIIRVPEAALENYLQADGWRNYADKIQGF